MKLAAKSAANCAIADFKRAKISAEIKGRKQRWFVPEYTFAANIRFPPLSFAAIPTGRAQKIHRISLPKSTGFQLKIQRISSQSPMDLESKSDGFFPTNRASESRTSMEKFSETAILATNRFVSASYTGNGMSAGMRQSARGESESVIFGPSGTQLRLYCAAKKRRIKVWHVRSMTSGG